MLRNCQFIYTERDLLKAIIDGWMMAERVALSPLSGLICEIVNSVGQGNFTVVRKRQEKSGDFRNLWLWQPFMYIGIFLLRGSFTVLGKPARSAL